MGETISKNISRAAQIEVRGESSVSLVLSLRREVRGSSCFSTLPCFSWELKTGCTAALPVRCSLLLHRACTALTLKLIAQKLASGVLLDRFLISHWYLWAILLSSSPAVNRLQLLGTRHVLWCCAFPGMLLLGLLPLSSGETFLSPPRLDAHKQVRYNTPRRSSLVQSRRAIPLSIISFPRAKQIVSKLPCKMWFYMVPIDEAIMEELGCNSHIIPQTSQGKCKDLK